MEKRKKYSDLSSVDHKGNDPFRVPGDYFDRFPERMMEKIRRAEEEPPRVVPLRRKIGYAAAVAAAVLVLTGGYLFLQKRDAGQNPVPVKKNVVAYIMSDDIDEQVLIEYIERENIVPDTLPEFGEEDSIIDYLMQEGVDESLLAELY